MSDEFEKYKKFYDRIEGRLRNMSLQKAKGKAKDEFYSDSIEGTVSEEELASDVFRSLYDIAWSNCDELDVCKREMQKYLNQIMKRATDANIIRKATIAYVLLTQTAQDEFKNAKMKNKYIEAIKFIANKNTKSTIKTNGLTKAYDLVPIEKKFDKFGPWEINRLFNHLKIYLVLPDDKQGYKNFPEIWKTDEKTVFNVEEKNITDKIFTELNKSSNLSLKEFILKELSINDQTDLVNFVKSLNSRNIYTVQDLINISDWEIIQRDFPAQYDMLRNSIDKYRFASNDDMDFDASKDDRTNAERIGDWHKVKLFLFHEANMKDETKSLGFLDKTALKDGFSEQRSHTDYGPVLTEVENSLQYFTEPERLKRNSSYGMIFYGPPGTGKTQLCKVIIKKAGLQGLVEPMSSAEVNRSKVGETEQLLMAIFHRAYYFKYLKCCIAIDEIDALVPKRNEKTGEHKVDVLSLLLSLIGGIKHVPNVFVIASTNRLNKIDDAFARRLENKFYVGRLNAEQRLKMMQEINNPEIMPNQNYRNLFDTKYRKRNDLLISLTTNFTGAAMNSFRSSFLKYLDANANFTLTEKEIEERMKILADVVAKDFQIKIGQFSIPKLLSKQSASINDLITKINDQLVNDLRNELNGRVLIDLRPDFRNIQFEKIDGTLKEISLSRDKRFVSNLMVVLLAFSFVFKVPYFQLIDSSLLLDNSAFDENLMIETILEKLNEYEQYENSMLVFDADTLVGISESLSDSLGESHSYSIQNNRIWQNIILSHFKAQFSDKDVKFDKHKWLIVISSSDFLIDQLKKLTKFSLCMAEVDLKVKKKTCVNCDLEYVECENKSESCNYHLKRELQRITRQVKNEGSVEIKTGVVVETKENLIKLAAIKGNTEIFDNYYYTCCMKRIDDPGCRKDKHKEKVNAKKSENSYSNKMNSFEL